MSSADQDAWVELAQAIRNGLRKAAELMPAMTPEEIKSFVEASNLACWLELNARDFDKKIDLAKMKTFPD